MIVPLLAVIVALPGLSTLTIPALPAALLTAAIEGEDELQITDCRILVFSILLVAVNKSVAPSGIGGFDGEIEMEVRSGKAKVAG